ncbi:MAG: MBL fold metallo-hydrolase [Planctomycetes bacterium]|nr:MBL fold metallo-hydrolase [Planctomycetota bacterium]NUQ34083.1 MBL fold metallo-hydrolase [Planctomycetaceae bacterium]
MAEFQRGKFPLFIRRFVTGIFEENTWFIRDEESGMTALVDPGEAVDEMLDDSGLLGDKPLDRVLLTHAHIDHVWGLSAVKQRWPKVEIRMHRDDLELLRALPRQGAMVGMPLPLPPAPEPDLFVGDGERFTFGKRSVEVIHTPGHTKGGICYLFDTGDLFLGDMIISGSVGRTDLPGGDPTKMKASLLRLTRLDPDIWIYGGHGPQSRLGDEMKTNAVLPHLGSL